MDISTLRILKALDMLTENERRVVEYRLGLNGERKTFKDIGKIFNRGVARVQQVYDRSLLHMKWNLEKGYKRKSWKRFSFGM